VALPLPCDLGQDSFSVADVQLFRWGVVWAERLLRGAASSDATLDDLFGELHVCWEQVDVDGPGTPWGDRYLALEDRWLELAAS